MLKKILAWLLVISTTATIAIGGTLAYLTDRDSEANVFTVGDVDITLNDEFQQESPLKPGVEIEKNVSITNEGPNDAYVWYTYAVPQGLENGLDLSFEEGTKWSAGELIGTKEVDGVTYNVYASKYSEAISAGVTTDVGLTKVTMDPAVDITTEGDAYLVVKGEPTDLEWNINDTENPVIFINAYAIQTQDFADVNAAYEAFKGQWGDMVEAGTYEAPDVWDGTADTSWYDEAKDVYEIYTAEQLAGVSALTNAKTTYFPNKTVKLMSDMDLDGREWKSIYIFEGTFDGNGHTISNYTMDTTASTFGEGFFLSVRAEGKVANLTLEDATIKAGRIFGVVSGNIRGTADHVSVKNVTVETTEKTKYASGFTYWLNDTASVSDCTVDNVTINAEKTLTMSGDDEAVVAGFVCMQETAKEIKNCHVKDFTATVNINNGQVAGFVGQNQTGWRLCTYTDCSVSGLDLTVSGGTNIGGFICKPGAHTVMNNCTAEGSIDASGVTNAKLYVGGFVGNAGWNDNLGDKGGHKFTNCSADVDVITGGAAAGGFIGSATNEGGKNMPIAFANCSAAGTVKTASGAIANIGGFAGEADRGTYTNCTATQNPFIGAYLNGFTLA